MRQGRSSRRSPIGAATGGTFEKETEASSLFEADDVKCKDGNQYDVKLDGSFKVISITRD